MIFSDLCHLVLFSHQTDIPNWSSFLVNFNEKSLHVEMRKQSCKTIRSWPVKLTDKFQQAELEEKLKILEVFHQAQVSKQEL